MDIIHRLLFKTKVSGTEFCLRIQLDPTDVATIWLRSINLFVLLPMSGNKH
jgi:hypothetical protein